MDPQPSFYFRVKFPDDQNISEMSFQEVSGIATEFNTETIEEGGENRFTYVVPKGIKHGNLVLKRGIADTSSELAQWCKTTLEGDLGTLISPKSVQVELLNAQGDTAMMWRFNNAYPVKWSIDGFNATKNDIVIETLEFSYTYSVREK